MPKMMDKSFLEDKDLKIAIINTLHMLKTKEHVKMKSILSEMKDKLNVINRLDAATEKIKNLKVSQQSQNKMIQRGKKEQRLALQEKI